MDISEVKATVEYDDVLNLIGRILTITDAVTHDAAQRKATKALVNGEVWDWWDWNSNYRAQTGQSSSKADLSEFFKRRA